MKQFTLLSLFIVLCIVFACNEKDASDATCGPDSTAMKQAIVWMPTNPTDSTRAADTLQRYGLELKATCPCNKSLQLWGDDIPIFGNEGEGSDKRVARGGSGGGLDILGISPNYQIVTPVALTFSDTVLRNAKFPPYQPQFKLGKKIIIGVLDSGLDKKMNNTVPFWVNVNERGSDEDKNGLKGDKNGWDFTTLSDHSLEFWEDDSKHGTMVTAFITDELKNGSYQVMPLKILSGKDKKGYLFNAICAMEYARQQMTKHNIAIDLLQRPRLAEKKNDIRGILNLSWGYYDLRSTALETMLQKLQNSNIAVIAAAGNEDATADRCETVADKRNLSERKYKFYPAAYNQFNNLIVANTLTSKEPSKSTYGYSLTPASNQNYSKDYVDIGVVADTSYEFYLPYTGRTQQSWGSSFAAPIVTAQIAKAINGGAVGSSKESLFKWLMENPSTGLKYVGKDSGLADKIKEGKITKRGIQP